MKLHRSNRFLSIILAITLMASLIPAASASHKPDWETWSQGGSDVTYRSTKNDGSLAFRAYGCHFMAHCKLMAEAGIVDPKTFNPDDYFNWVVSHGYIYGKQPNGTYAIGEKNIGASMIDYARERGTSISQVAAVSLSGRTPAEKKSLIQQYISQGYYIILDCKAHETYIMRAESLKKGTPWISDSGSRYKSVSRSSGIYAYTGVYKGGGGWEAAFDKVYLYSVGASAPTTSFTPPPAPSTNNGNTTVSASTITGVADSITQTSAILRGSVSSSGVKLTQCGVLLGTSKQNMTKLGSDSINTYGTTCFYSTSKYGRTLTPGTTYYYQIYAVDANGKEYKGDTRSFTTALCTNHVKGKYLWYAQVHPHYDHYICSVCGQQFRTTTTNNVSSCKICNPDSQPCTNHVKGEYLWYIADHPHYNYYTCSVCGEQFTDHTTSNMPSCKTCNPEPESCSHVKGKYLWFAAVHPHYNHYSCAKCGQTYREPETNFWHSCEICAPINAYGIRLSELSTSGITANSVRLDASCAYTGSRPTSVGVYLGTSTSNMQIKGSDGNINHNKNPFSIWYNLNGLQPGTTYYYRFYAVVDGKVSFSEIKSFTTTR